MTASPDEVTRLLLLWRTGDERALSELMPLVYEDLGRMASALLRMEEEDPLLQPAALVHEIYLRLCGIRAPGWETRTHFYAFLARMMRQLLIDHARTRRRTKRGRGALHLPLEEAWEHPAPDAADRRAVSEALGALQRREPRLGKIVELRYFVGLSTAETAAACGISAATVKRDWQSARVWLRRALG